MERSKQSDVVSFTFFPDETRSTVLNALKGVDRGKNKTRKENMAVVKT